MTLLPLGITSYQPLQTAAYQPHRQRGFLDFELALLVKNTSLTHLCDLYSV